MRLCQPPDGNTSPKYKLLCFITTKFFCKENKNALAFNRDRCCHLVLCLRLIPFHQDKSAASFRHQEAAWVSAGNNKGGSITVPLASCLTGLNQSVLQIKTKIVRCHTADSKPVKPEVNGTVFPLVFPGLRYVLELSFSEKSQNC